MTVNYNLCVSTSSPFSLFKLLLRWKGSIWKSVMFEVALWLCMFNVVSVVYRVAMPDSMQRDFSVIISWISHGLEKLPLDFMLGFFVTIIVNRWNVLFENIGLIDSLALTISGYLTGVSAQERLWRRNVVRYCVLAQVLVFRDISMQVRNRFPSIDTVVAAGFMLPHERETFDELQYGYGKLWMPFQWAICALRKARARGSISSDYLLEKCCEQVRKYRSNMATLTNYDWVPIPIMYPQIVFLAVYSYFTLAVVGFQPIIPGIFENVTGNGTGESGSHDFQTISQDKIQVHPGFGDYVPLMSTLKFVLYMGWLKVAEALMNPLGEDDDDFETNFLIDRNMTIGLAIVDQCYDDAPEERPDVFWSSGVVALYSEQSASRAINPLEGSASAVELPDSVQTVNMVTRESTDSVRKRTVSIRRASTSTARNLSRKDSTKARAPSHCYDNKVSTIDEIEMDEISLRSTEDRNTGRERGENSSRY